jgi:flagellar biosynthetic protein FliO
VTAARAPRALVLGLLAHCMLARQVLAQTVSTQAAPDAGLPSGGDLTRSLFAIVVVFGLLGAAAYLAKRGLLGGFGRQGRSLVKVEGAVPLGERRSLMVVSVEGRRLLLGLTPMTVSLVTELSPQPTAPDGTPFDKTLARTISGANPS